LKPVATALLDEEALLPYFRDELSHLNLFSKADFISNSSIYVVLRRGSRVSFVTSQTEDHYYGQVEHALVLPLVADSYLVFSCRLVGFGFGVTWERRERGIRE
jgi:hypothetical protein